MLYGDLIDVLKGRGLKGIMKKKKHNNLHQLEAKVAAAETNANATRLEARAAKVLLKKARKAYKEAKRAAKDARKWAKSAAQDLEGATKRASKLKAKAGAGKLPRTMAKRQAVSKKLAGARHSKSPPIQRPMAPTALVASSAGSGKSLSGDGVRKQTMAMTSKPVNGPFM